TAISLQDVSDRNGIRTPDGVPDLVVTNSGSNTLTVLPGIGTTSNPSGFFAGLDSGGFNVSVGGGAPAPLPQPIPPPRGNNGDILVARPDGGLDRVPNDLVPRQIFTPPAGLLPTSFAFNNTGQFLFVGTDGGGIEVFQEDVSGAYTVFDTTIADSDLH